jgi:hypothetical protein
LGYFATHCDKGFQTLGLKIDSRDQKAVLDEVLGQTTAHIPNANDACSSHKNTPVFIALGFTRAAFENS